jgi:hypothetical protein
MELMVSTLATLREGIRTLNAVKNVDYSELHALAQQLPPLEQWVWTVAGDSEPCFFGVPVIYFEFRRDALVALKAVNDDDVAVWPEVPVGVERPMVPEGAPTFDMYALRDADTAFSLWRQPAAREALRMETTKGVDAHLDTFLVSASCRPSAIRGILPPHLRARTGARYAVGPKELLELMQNLSEECGWSAMVAQYEPPLCFLMSGESNRQMRRNLIDEFARRAIDAVIVTAAGDTLSAETLGTPIWGPC